MTLTELKELFKEHKRNGVFRDIGGMRRSIDQQLDEEGPSGNPFILSCLDIHNEVIYLSISVDDTPFILNQFELPKC